MTRHMFHNGFAGVFGALGRLCHLAESCCDGTIQFSPTGPGGGVTGASRIEDGQFSIPREKGLVPGTYSVSINSAGKRDRAKSAMAGPRSAFAKELIPAQYNAKSTLKAEVKKGGSYDLKFELQSQ